MIKVNELIEVKMPGAVLFLTPDEFTRAVKRGKGILRHRRAQERAAKRAQGQGAGGKR